MKNHPDPNHICEVCQPLKPASSALFGGPMPGRREFFKLAGAGVTGFFLSPLLAPAEVRADSGAKLMKTARNCIFILLSGAPSHVDTFDLKVGAYTPADFNPTTYNGVSFPQGLLPTVATQLDKIAIVRSLRAPALVHSLQQVWVQISRNPSAALGKIAPNIGSVVALEFEAQRQPNQKLPGFVSLNTGGNLIGAGYFNARYTPFDVTAAPTGLGNLANADGQTLFNSRYTMLQALDNGLRADTPLGDAVIDMDGFYQQSRGMMYNPEVDAVFKFTTDDQTRYGNNGFGNSCIVARNLLKANLGTRYIQINIGGWDNHTNIYAKPGGIYTPAGQFDKGFGNLLADLAALPGLNGGSLLGETLIVAMGEFGRTVGALTSGQGRDHYFQHFAAFAGGGIAGGRIIGRTNDTGQATVEPGWSQNRSVANEDIAATIYSALGIDYTTKRTDDPFGRGFEYVPFASEGAWYPVLELFAHDRSRATTPTPPPGPRSGGRRTGP
ncbi:MAG: DUF1501 domain-containing protein [Blastocatellia bacterium]